MSMSSTTIQAGKTKYRLSAEGHIIGLAFGQKTPRSSIACRHHQARSNFLPAYSECMSEEASTSGQSISNIPSVLESLVQNLPARSKRRKLLLATTSLTSLVARWTGDHRSISHSHSGLPPASWASRLHMTCPSAGRSAVLHAQLKMYGAM